MPVHEYKVIPAPTRAPKAKGARTTAEKFALSLTLVMNDLGREGWEYVRAETLSCEERKGWLRRADTSFQTLLIFRREVDAEAAQSAPAITGTATGERRRWPDPGRGAPSDPPPLSAVGPEGPAPRIAVSSAAPPVPALERD